MTARAQNFGLSSLLAATACLLLSTMNAVIKYLTTAGYPTFQIAFFNGFIGLCCLVLWLAATSNLGRLKTKEPLMGVYVVAALGACYTLFYAYGHGKLADVTAVVATFPLMIAALGYVFLRERLTHKQLILIFVAFGGALLVLRPRPELADYVPLVMAVGGTFLLASSQIVVRKLSHAVYPLAFTFYFYAGQASLFGLLNEHWVIEKAHLPIFLLSGVLDVCSLALLYTAYKHAPASRVAPFQYTQIIWAILIGYAIWQEFPDSWSVTGAGVIVGAGILFARSMNARKTKDVNVTPQP